MHNHYTTKFPITKALTIILAVVVLFAVYSLQTEWLNAKAERTVTEAWILCSDYINIRMWPSKKATSVGQLDPCDEIEVDGRTKDGFAHIVSPVDGWVHAGYITFSKPEAIGETYSVCAKKRVACRRWIDGPKVDRRPWLINGSEVQVLFMSDDWAVTSRGYVKSEWLEAAP